MPTGGSLATNCSTTSMTLTARKRLTSKMLSPLPASSGLRSEALEQAMSEHWLETQKDESQEIQDEGEDFFNSLDPKSWQE